MLSLALVEGLAAQTAPRDTVLLTGRDPDALRTAAAALAGAPAVARVEGGVLDVRDGDAIAALAVALALAREFDAGYYGELVQFGRILPWGSGVPVPRTVTV